MRILFLGETYRADAQTWIRGIERASGFNVETDEVIFSKSSFIRAFRFFKLIFKYWIFRRTYNYDIVLAERSTSYGFASIFVNTKVRIVAQQGSTDLYPAKWFHRIYKGLIQKWVYRKSDLIHAWGQTMASHMRKIGVPKEKILVLSKGIDLNHFGFEEPYKKDKSIWRLIVTRSLENYYCHNLILHSIADLKNKGYKLHLDIVGGGSLELELKMMAKKLGLAEVVEFHGRISNARIAELLRRAHLYVSAPITEGFSASLVEAMACGCIPVVSDLEANRVIIQNGINGFLFGVGSKDQLSDSISTAIRSFDLLSLSIESNRRFVEAQADTNCNMSIFWDRYLYLFKNKSIKSSKG